MKVITKCMSFVFLILLNISCGNNREENIKELKKNISNLDELISLISTKYNYEIEKSENRNRIIFSNRSEKKFKSNDLIDDELINKKMKSLNIKEIIFKKVESTCNGNNGFTKISCTLEKEYYEETSYYLYEYCGVSSEYKSATIYYKPVDKNWSLYVESN